MRALLAATSVYLLATAALTALLSGCRFGHGAAGHGEAIGTRQGIGARQGIVQAAGSAR
ncbi:hypothetical protein ABZW11_12490 [Nonomuraea sp. NPDC004580]|uniref:hypothetical protein n=1 Tax=Nonomuraea sp. NPDC004580 TaxID=3154552 RepID=UPI0033A9D225